MNCDMCQAEMKSTVCEACGWSNPESTKYHAPQIRDTTHRLEEGISKDIFGTALYEAIKCIGGILCLHKQLHLTSVHRRASPVRRQEMEAKSQHLWTELDAHMCALNPNEHAQLCERYPWIIER